MPGSEVDELDNTADVETPERIRFRYHVAGPVRRGLAYLLDLVIRGLILMVTAMLGFAGGLGQVRASGGLWLLMAFAIEWGYGVVFEGFWNGQTPGKRALGLRVVKDGGYPVGFIDALLRNLLRTADFLPVGYLLGALVMTGDRRFRRLGDLVAGTMVVIESQATVGAPIALDPPATPAELATLPHRPPVSSDELEAIELLLRRPLLSEPRRLELAQMVAPVFATRMGVREGNAVRFLGLLYQRCVGQSHAAAAPGAGARR